MSVVDSVSLLPDHLLECIWWGLIFTQNGGILNGINTARTFEHTVTSIRCIVGILAFIFQIVNKNSWRQT